MNKLIKISLLVSMSIMPNYGLAEANGMQKSLSNIWSSLGGSSVSTGAAYYKGQKRGHYTMGSMYFARAKQNRSLIDINFPQINIDKSCYNQGVLNFGGMSFISSEELKNKLQNIVQQSGMMFVYLGIGAISPVIHENLQEVFSKIQELGGFLSDECQASKQIVSMIGDKLSQHSTLAKDIFSRHETDGGNKSDLSNAYRSFPKGKNAALSAAADKNEKLTIQDVNIAWKALDKLKNVDQKLKEMMMTMSGTIIIAAPKDDHNPPGYRYISSAVTSPSTLSALLKGDEDKGDNKLKMLECGTDDKKCLNVTESDELIKKEDSFESKVSGYFEEFKEAIKEDAELGTGAQEFLSKSGLPVYKIYDVLYQYSDSHPEYEQGIVVEIVAWNILYNYLSDILKEVNEATNNLQLAANEELKEFKESIKSAQKVLAEFEMKDLSRYKLQLFIVKRSENMEQMMADEVSQMFAISKKR